MKLVAAACANNLQVHPQAVWSDIQATRPDVLLLLGDNIYLADDRLQDPAALAQALRSLYARQWADPHFSALLRGRTGALVISGDAHRNAAYDESGIVELVTSAVAQRSLRFGAARQNYAVLCFEASAVEVAMRSRKAGSRFQFSIPRADWQLP